MDKSYQIAPDIDVLPAHFPIPGTGFLQINAFVIKAREPVLVDTGMGMENAEFMKALESIIDLEDLRWVWITHDDADHIGSIHTVLESAPNARLVANSLAVLRMSTAWQVPLDRVYWLNSDECINVGDRVLTAIRPPLFDNPTTIGIHDNKSDVFFAADCFGAILPSPTVQNVDDVANDALPQGMISWASSDCPWIHMVEPGIFSQSLFKIHQISPKMILSSHLPPAIGKTEHLLEILAKVPTSTPFVTPNQNALNIILDQMKTIPNQTHPIG